MILQILYSGIPFDLKAQLRIISDPSKNKGWKKNTFLIFLVTRAPHEEMSNRELIEKYGYIRVEDPNRKNLYTTLNCRKYTNGKNIRDMKIGKENYLYIFHGKSKLCYIDLSSFGTKLENLQFSGQFQKLKIVIARIFVLTMIKIKNIMNMNIFILIKLLFFQNLNQKNFELVDIGKIKLDLLMHIRYDKSITGRFE